MDQEYADSGRDTTGKVSRAGRTISAIAGSLLLYRTVKRHKADTFLLLAGGYLVYRAASGNCPISATVSRFRKADHPRNINVRTSVIVNRPREMVYAFWRRLENLPLFMKHLDSVYEIDETRSTWNIKIPGGLATLHWGAEIVNEQPGSVLSWQSIPGASIENAGKINFTDTPGKGTRIHALISYRALNGVVGETVSRLLNPVFSGLIEKDILNFKHYMENI